MHSQIIKSGPKNFSVLIRGFVREKDFAAVPVVDLAKIEPPTSGWKGLRLDSALWLLEEKLGLYLWWENRDREEDHNFILPMESRNFVRFDEGIPSPRVADKWGKQVWMSSFNFKKDNPSLVRKSFMVILDFDKQ